MVFEGRLHFTDNVDTAIVEAAHDYGFDRRTWRVTTYDVSKLPGACVTEAVLADSHSTKSAARSGLLYKKP